MSQNAHRLLLVFDDEQTHKNCLLMLLRLNEQKFDQAAVFAERLGIDISHAWEEDWFNHDLKAQPEYLRIDYDSSTRYDMPLDVLQQLFDCGLRGAALEIFHDQVGEFSQYFFCGAELVDKKTLLAELPQFEELTQTHFECDPEELEDDGYERPMSIDDLIDMKQQQQEDAEEFAGALMDMFKHARETGSNPMDMIKGAFALRAIIKGVLYAIGFGVVTVLLFKGMWLWITLSILLVFILPIWFLFTSFKDLGGGDDEPEAEQV